MNGKINLIILSNINTELTSLRDRCTKMELQLLVTKSADDNLVKQNRILEKKRAANKLYSYRECVEISGIPDGNSNNNLEQTLLKIIKETGVTVNSRDAEACHCLNQPANPKKLVTKLSKRNNVARVMDNKKEVKKYAA